MAVCVIQWNHWFDQFSNTMFFAKCFQLERCSLLFQWDVAGVIRPGPKPCAGFFGFGSKDFGLPLVAITKGKDAGLQVVGPRQIADKVSEEQLPVEGEGGVVDG